GEGDGDGDSGDGDPTAGAECSDGDEQCKVADHLVCEGGVWASQPCPDGSFCDEVSDRCVACVCEPGEPGGCADAEAVEVCRADCSGYQPQPCAAGVCVDGGCVE